ncbi:MAG: Thioredoxin reductase [archaeon]|jgi:thioredoxin reductase (NADPH)
MEKNRGSSDLYDVIIIGAGPAGYTAGIYTSRAGRKTLLLSGILPGGQLMNTTLVENFPGFEEGIMGPELMEIIRAQTKKMGTEIIDERVIRVDFKKKPFKVSTKTKEYLGKAVIICTGADYKKLEVKGELELAGRGVSYCAVCDGPFFKNEEIVVVGGGDSAMEEALFLTQFGKKIHVIHRREDLKASNVMQERAFANKKIQFHWNSEVKEIRGTEKVDEIIIHNNKTKKDSTLKTGAVFIAIGHIPNSRIFEGQVQLDARGYIVVKNRTETSTKGVFVAGDVHDHLYRQAVTAAGFGCMAALDVDRYLSEE